MSQEQENSRFLESVIRIKNAYILDLSARLQEREAFCGGMLSYSERILVNSMAIWSKMASKNAELQQMGKKLEECERKLHSERHFHDQARTELVRKDKKLNELRERLERSENELFWQQNYHDRAMREAYTTLEPPIDQAVGTILRTPTGAPPARHNSIFPGPDSNLREPDSSPMSRQPASIGHGTRSWAMRSAEMGNEGAGPSNGDRHEAGEMEGYEADLEDNIRPAWLPDAPSPPIRTWTWEEFGMRRIVYRTAGTIRI
ncbi:MAG: hypothetical protein ALECFALPRED_003499 [Alectoria fallacina]|uniref:Uncharacterized protein n=1 Tax=Alectoria fallacina TaxID=1903189 RepID=A0A8H3FLA3_9LECA|nr:MAG: hypothetical protein ALECFALPRED_003499 [Alectoria fallacina]